MDVNSPVCAWRGQARKSDFSCGSWEVFWTMAGGVGVDRAPACVGAPRACTPHFERLLAAHNFILKSVVQTQSYFGFHSFRESSRKVLYSLYQPSIHHLARQCSFTSCSPNLPLAIPFCRLCGRLTPCLPAVATSL